MEEFTNVYVIDGGKISITVYQPALDEQNFDDVEFQKPIEESYSALSYEEFLRYQFQPNSLVIGENAHFGTARTERSYLSLLKAISFLVSMRSCERMV